MAGSVKVPASSEVTVRPFSSSRSRWPSGVADIPLPFPIPGPGTNAALAQLRLDDPFGGLGLGKGLDQLDVARHHETGHARLEIGAQLLGLERQSGLRGDEQEDLVLAGLGGNGDRSTFGDLRIELHVRLDLERGYVLAA